MKPSIKVAVRATLLAAIIVLQTGCLGLACRKGYIDDEKRFALNNLNRFHQCALSGASCTQRMVDALRGLRARQQNFQIYNDYIDRYVEMASHWQRYENCGPGDPYGWMEFINKMDADAEQQRHPQLAKSARDVVTAAMMGSYR